MTWPHAQVARAKWFMEAYGGFSPKPHYAWANTDEICQLNTRPRPKRKFDESDNQLKIKTCEQYTNKEGKKCFKGTKDLRKTENLIRVKGIYLMVSIPMVSDGSLVILSWGHQVQMGFEFQRGF